MIACRSLFRYNSVAWKTTSSLQYLQKYNLFHCLSCELKMDIHKKKGKTVRQTWRAVSTQPNLSQGDGEKGELQSRQAEMNHSVPLTVSEAKCESSNSRVVNKPIGSDTCHSAKDDNNGSSSDGKLMPPEKHSISMEIGGSLMRFVKGKGGVTQEEIEAETGAKIIFPSSEKEDSIIIEGNSAESVAKASQKVHIIIDKAVNSRELDYSHFVSLPLAIHLGLVEKLINFQNTILGIASSDKNGNVVSKSGGDTSNEEDKDSTKASKVAVDLKADEPDSQIEVHIKSEDHSTKDPHVAVELKAGDDNTSVKVNITDIPLVSYPHKEAKTLATETRSSKLLESGIDKSIFIKPKTFHLTVLMLKLWNKDRVKTAAEVLQSVSPKVMDALDDRPVVIRLKGLDCMRGSLSKARVIYAPVEEIGAEGRLLRACQAIIDAFVEAGLVLENDAQQKLKLHATLMNARHRKRIKRTREVDSFDARGIFDLYGSEEWGVYPIRGAHLSQRFLFDENGYYHCCASIPFPEDIVLEQIDSSVTLEDAYSMLLTCEARIQHNQQVLSIPNASVNVAARQQNFSGGRGRNNFQTSRGRGRAQFNGN